MVSSANKQKTTRANIQLYIELFMVILNKTLSSKFYYLGMMPHNCSKWTLTLV